MINKNPENNIIAKRREKVYNYDGTHHSFDGYALDTLQIKITIKTAKECDELINLLKCTKCCFLVGGHEINQQTP